LDPATLKKIPLFAEVPDDVLSKVAPWATVEEWPEGKVIVKEGGFSNHFYAIEEGTVSVERDGEHLADLGPGDVFGEQGLLEKQERSATVTAKCASSRSSTGSSRGCVSRCPRWSRSFARRSKSGTSSLPAEVDSAAKYGRWSREVRCETGAVPPL
jgi:hypothetical protein